MEWRHSFIVRYIHVSQLHGQVVYSQLRSSLFVQHNAMGYGHPLILLLLYNGASQHRNSQAIDLQHYFVHFVQLGAMAYYYLGPLHLSELYASGV